MNMEFVKRLENIKQLLKKHDSELRAEYNKEGKTAEEKNNIVMLVKQNAAEYYEAVEDSRRYKVADSKTQKEIEEKYNKRYNLRSINEEEELPEELPTPDTENNEEEEEVVAVKKPNKTLRALSYIGVAGLAVGVGYGLASCSNKNAEVLNAETEVEDLDVDAETEVIK